MIGEVIDCPECDSPHRIEFEVEGTSLRHLTLTCGHTIEVVIVPKIQVGDAVLLTDELFRVDDIFKSNTGETLASIRNEDGEFEVTVTALDFVARDTLSGMDAEPLIVGGFQVGAWVEHKKHQTRGQIVEVKPDGRYKAEVYNVKNNTFTYYIWDPIVLKPSAPSEVHKAARSMAKPTKVKPGLPGPSSYDWDDRYRSYNTGSSSSYRSPSYKPTTVKKKEKPKPPDMISTASLIKKEVTKLEKSDREDKAGVTRLPTSTKPKSTVSKLRTTTSPVSKPSSSSSLLDPDPDDAPIPKRKGTW